jgi:hypothetical protein
MALNAQKEKTGMPQFTFIFSSKRLINSLAEMIRKRFSCFETAGAERVLKRD